MFVRFVRDYYLNTSRLFAAGETADVDAQLGARFIAEGAAVDMVRDNEALGGGYTTLAMSGVPSAVPSSGTIGDNGALSGLTAFPVVYSLAVSGGIYLYFPANAVYAGSPSGFYYTIMSSTTAGTIYQEMWSGDGVMLAPPNPTPWVTTGPGAYTQTTAVTLTLSSITLPANTLNTRGSVLSNAVFSYTNSANNKTMGRMYNATAATITNLTTSASFRCQAELRFRDRVNAAAHHPSIAAAFGQSGTPVNIQIQPLTADILLRWTGLLAAATDFIVLEAYNEMFLAYQRP